MRPRRVTSIPRPGEELSVTAVAATPEYLVPIGEAASRGPLVPLDVVARGAKGLPRRRFGPGWLVAAVVMSAMALAASLAALAITLR